MQVSRRHVLQFGAAPATGGLAPVNAAREKVPVALQLYSLRDGCKADIARTIAAVAKMKGEFTKLPGGGIPWQRFFDATGKDVLQQLDLGRVLRAGADPAVHLRRYPGRTATMHMKDYSPSKDKVPIGEGGMKCREVIGLAEAVGGIQWYILEQESDPYPPLESVARSYDNLKRILAQRA